MGSVMVASKREVHVGNIIICRVGVNPYARGTDDNPYAIGIQRVNALRIWRDTGVLPDGYKAWDSRVRCDILDVNAIEIIGLRD